jgi:hypothetical protein
MHAKYVGVSRGKVFSLRPSSVNPREGGVKRDLFYTYDGMELFPSILSNSLQSPLKKPH